MLKKSLIIATCITLTLFGIILYIGTLYAQYNPGTGTQYPPKHSGQGGRDFGYYFHEVGTTGTYIQYYGTQSVTGSGTTGRITGTSSALPHVEYNYVGGTPTFNYVGGTLQNEGVDVTVATDLSGYIAVTGGTGTGNVLTNTTLDGTGTISANVSISGNITANSLEITPTELGYLNNATSEIQAQITTATGSITNHAHSGNDGTTQISHNSVTGTGTNSHTTLDTFVSSKAQASGLASLDGSSLVVQNPASGTTTPTASKILIADGVGKIDDGWLNSTITALGQTIALGTETTGNTDNVAEGSSNLYYLDSRVNAAVGTLSINVLSDVTITSPAEGHKFSYLGGVWSNATDTAIVAWSGITGIPTDNGSVTVNSAASTIPFRDASQNLFASGIVGGTTTGALRIPSGTTAQRPASPEIGMIRTAFSGTYYAASGGTITTSGTYTIHTFTASGSFVPAGTQTSYNAEFYDGGAWTIIGTGTTIGVGVEYLVVAGGGGGGGDGNTTGGGGGGAGGMLTGTMTVASCSVVVGAGGTAGVGTGGNNGGNGNDSTFSTITATGGGGGCSKQGGSSGGIGGSGGGGNYNSPGGAGTTGQGYAGGSAYVGGNNTGGGGGGKSAVGANAASTTGGNGGNGLASSISGSSVTYAGGGGGGGGTPGGGTAGTGGTGGGGNAGATGGQNAGQAGTANSGGGGGGASTTSTGVAGGVGGSGIVIIRYPTP